jgi:hypothetical protein
MYNLYMNSTNKKIIAVAIVLVLLLGVFFATKNKSSESTSGAEKTEQKASSGETMMSGSMFDLMKTGNTTKCTYSTVSDKTKMMGTTYVSGKNMRSDTEITLEGGKTMESHMISDGTWVYSWTSALPQGMKMNISELEKPATAAPSSTNTTVKNFQDKFDFKCTKWNADSSKFVVPTDVTFTDFSETMKKLENGGAAMCSACDYTPDADAKAKCKAQFNCK